MTSRGFWLGAKLWLFLTLALAGKGTAAADYELVAQPVWVVNETVSLTGEVANASDGMRYLQSDDQINLAGESPVWYRRTSYEVEEARALSSAGQFSIGYQPEYQKVQIHAIDVWRNGRRQDRRAQAHMEVLRREADLEAGLIDGAHTLNVTIPDVQVGDRIEYDFSIVGFNPVFGRDYYDSYSASFSEPLGLKRVKVIYPPDLGVRWRVNRKQYRVSEGAAGPDRYVEIAASGLDKVEGEADVPDSFDPYGRIEISTADGWSHVAQWAAGIYPDRFADRRLAAAMAKELRLDARDAMGSLLRAIRYVQGEIRYTGLEMGVNSHAPHSPESVVARRFGDCKDKAVLLVSLLREAGVAARPVLVNTVRREAIADRLPSALAFDHVVVSADLAGKTYWIDPTRDVEQGDLGSRDPLYFRLGLPVDASSRRLVDIPYPAPAQPEVDVGQHIRIGERAGEYSADFVVVTDYRGLRADGMRVDFRSEGASAMGKKYLEYMRGFYDGILQAHPPRISDASAGAIARTTESYRLGWNKDADGDVFAILLFQLTDWMPVLKQDSRISPLVLGGPRYVRQTVRTEVENGWSLRDQVEEVRNPYFTFTRSLKVDGKSLVIVGEWRRLADQAPAKDYPLLKKDFKRARDLLEFDIDLSSDYSGVLDIGFRAWLLPLLAIVLLGALLWASWLLRARNAFAGMMFRPRSTMPSRLGSQSMSPGTWGLIAAATLLDVAIDRGAEYVLQPDAVHFGMMIGASLGFLLRFFLYVALLLWAFRLLSKRIPYRDLAAAVAWGAFPPLILFIGCGLLAVGFDIRIYAKTFVADPQQTPGVLVSAAMAMAALVWSLVGAINAYSVAAASSRRFAFAAMCLALLLTLLIAGPFFLLAFLAK